MHLLMIFYMHSDTVYSPLVSRVKRMACGMRALSSMLSSSLFVLFLTSCEHAHDVDNREMFTHLLFLSRWQDKRLHLARKMWVKCYSMGWEGGRGKSHFIFGKTINCFRAEKYEAIFLELNVFICICRLQYGRRLAIFVTTATHRWRALQIVWTSLNCIFNHHPI